MSRWKALPWLLGVALMAVALVAALRLPAPDTDHAGGGGGKGPPPASPAAVGGITTIGVVDTLPGVLAINPPAVMGMAALSVKKVHVKDGDAVQPGTVLVEFDPGGLAHKPEQAKAAVMAAQWTLEQAIKKRDDHPQELKRAALAVEKAEEELRTATLARDIARKTLDETLDLGDLTKNGAKYSEAEKELRRERNPELQKAEAAVRLLPLAVKAAKLNEESLKAVPVDADVNKATFEVSRLQALEAEAKATLDGFTLKAQVGGTVEQVAVAEGMTVGPAARTPLLYLVPTGPRVVRAEVEAEFAHKIDAFVGKPVTIRAGEKFNDTYAGVARRVNVAFLPKRFGGDSLVGTAPRALECTIDVPDPAPAGKPPLRPGQPVRVEFGR